MAAVATKLCEHPGACALSTGRLQLFLMFHEIYLDRFETVPDRLCSNPGSRWEREATRRFSSAPPAATIS
jgi:hypothetical protein